MNERITEDLVDIRLRCHGYYDDGNPVVIEKQTSTVPKIAKLLRHASKSGIGPGKPEFIIYSNNISDFIIVVECKADATKHASASKTKYRDYAVDGVLLYSSFLSKEFDVLAIAVSGQDDASLRISHYLHLRGTPKPISWEEPHEIISFDEYYQAFIVSDEKFRQDYQALVDYSRILNNHLQSKKITEAQRSFLISGILIAMKNNAFRKSYQSHQTGQQLLTNLLTTISAEFENASIPINRRDILMQSFSFLTTLPIDKSFIEELIQSIDENINAFMRTHKYYDTIGQFYVEFLRYANNDKGLGIVLTPHHIADLFARLADVNQDSIVFDNCCGTAGLLIAAMKQMVRDGGLNNSLKKRIKSQQLFGIEYQPHVYALAVCNMILHGDGKANIYRGNCFDHNNSLFDITDMSGKSIQVKPTVGFLNPPYKNKRIPDDKEELEFVLNNLEYLDRDRSGRCVAIVPITCATNPTGKIGELKRRLLERHTLEAVMSMPVELFHNSRTTVVTCIMVFTAHRPHSAGKKTWFGYWRDDGFIKIRYRGRIDLNGTWSRIRDRWLQAFVNREIIDGLSVMREVSPEDEWCAEAYLVPDYDTITQDRVSEACRRYFVNQAMIKADWI